MMANRWTKMQIDHAHKIVNDIAEGIDNRESRAELRISLAIYADLLHDKHHAQNDAKMDRVLNMLEQITNKKP